MQKSCTNCGQNFEITQDDLKFYDKVSPIFAGKKEMIPPPTLCPDCRQQRRLAVSNELHLYPGACGHCGKHLITQRPPTQGKIVYCRECWNGDKWDSLACGQDVVFTRPFFEQFVEVRDHTPEMALYTGPMIQNAE